MGNCCTGSEKSMQSMQPQSAVYQQPVVYQQPSPSHIPPPVNTYIQVPPIQTIQTPPVHSLQTIRTSPIHSLQTTQTSPVRSLQNYSPINRPMVDSYYGQTPSPVTNRDTIISENYEVPPKTRNPPEEDAVCLNCSENQVDTDTDGFPSEYCSDSCRREAFSAGFSNPCIQCKEFPRITGSDFCGWKKCRNLPLCLHCKTERVFPRSLWCSKSCRDKTPNWQNLIIEKSSQLCLNCNRNYALSNQDFCGNQCEHIVRDKAPCLLKLPANGQKYRDITNQFRHAWRHPHKSIPDVDSVWKIYCTDEMNNRYNIYREEVEKDQKLAGKPFPKGDGRRLMSAGNEQRRFHGTKMSCFIGLINGEVCQDKSCSVCCIIKEGYKLRFVGTGTISAAFQRFGRGIYFSGTSSKSDDYNEGSLKNNYGTNYKVMLLNKVVVGKGFPLTKDNMTLTDPPPGYDSVLGEPSETGNLNYDEVVVYKEEASIPQYLIVYKVA